MSPDSALSAARLRAIAEVAAGVKLFEIVPADGAAPYPVGSHMDIAVSVDGLPDVRSYSLVGRRPHDGAYRIAVKHLPDGRGGSGHLHGLEPGASARVSRPRSQFELDYGRSEYLLVAGGIGITPMIGMAEALVQHGRPLRLLYAGRSRDEMPFVSELRDLLGERLELFVSQDGDRLRLSEEIDRLADDGELYLCGPLRLREAAQEAWHAAGRPPQRLRYETFASGGRHGSEPFVVRLQDHDGQEITVPRSRSMLDALGDAGIELMWDCRRGECGLCRVTVLDAEGELDHRDVYLSAAERAAGRDIITCVSRASGGAITIDTGFRREPGRHAPVSSPAAE